MLARPRPASHRGWRRCDGACRLDARPDVCRVGNGGRGGHDGKGGCRLPVGGAQPGPHARVGLDPRSAPAHHPQVACCVSARLHREPRGFGRPTPAAQLAGGRKGARQCVELECALRIVAGTRVHGDGIEPAATFARCDVHRPLLGVDIGAVVGELGRYHRCCRGIACLMVAVEGNAVGGEIPLRLIGAGRCGEGAGACDGVGVVRAAAPDGERHEGACARETVGLQRRVGVLKSAYRLLRREVVEA